MPILLSGLQNRTKNCAAYAEELGLMLITNGEELPYLLSPQGEIIQAGITPPSEGPIITDNGSGLLTNGDYAVYATVYVSENSFPLVAAVLQSNPSGFTTYHITGSGTRKVNISAAVSTNPFVTHIYFYRTALQTTAPLAETAAAAGLLNFVGKVANTGSPILEDNTSSYAGNDPIQLSNYTAPQFKFSVWDGSFFWGFGNHPFNAQATWQLDGTLVSTQKLWGGRDGQFITFDGVTTGGIDGRGTFLFKQIGDFAGKVTYADGSDALLTSTATGNMVIIGESATLYRSAYRNPFSWGYSQAVGNLFIPALWQLKVSGSLGTAIAIIPDQQLLKLDMEFPALCLTFSLQSASTDVFAQTRRQVSRLYSITSHFSQFSALAKGRQVLWGMDYKNLAIVECDGYTQVPISGPISILLRNLSKNRSLHLICHGIYDPATEINALWLSSSFVDGANAPAMFDLCVYQHAPTGFWGVVQDYGILCSAAVEDTVTSTRSTLVGTENGFIGKAFDFNTYGNWLPTNSLYNGFINSATVNSITRSEGQDDFDSSSIGLIGNFCLVVDANGLNPQILKIAGVTGDTLTFEQNLSIVPNTTDDPGLVDGQSQFFVGLIELRVLKYFDGGEPSEDKAPREYWATLSDANSALLEYYPEHETTPTQAIQLQHDSGLDAWFTKEDFPTKKEKSFGLALVNREYSPVQLFNFSLT